MYNRHYDIRRVSRFEETLSVCYAEAGGPKTSDTFHWGEEDDLVRLEGKRKAQRQKLDLAKIDPGLIAFIAFVSNSCLGVDLTGDCRSMPPHIRAQFR